VSLSALVTQIWQTGLFVAHDTPATHGAGGYNAFAITGGPVWIKAFLEYNNTAIGGATTTHVAIGAVGLDAGALAIGAAAQYTFVVSPLDGAVAKLAVPALTVQMPSLLGFATNMGVVSGPGLNITVTFAGAAMGGAERVSYFVVYQKLSPQSLIA
jgi:hypothetical protein